MSGRRRFLRDARSRKKGGLGHQAMAEIHSRMRLKQRYGVCDRLDQGLILADHQHALSMGRTEELGTRSDGSTVHAIEDRGRLWYFAVQYGIILTYLIERQAWRNVGREAELDILIRLRKGGAPSIL